MLRKSPCLRCGYACFRRASGALRSPCACRLQQAAPPLRQRAFLRRPDRTLETLWECASSMSLCKRRSDRSLSARRLSRPAPAAPIGLPARLFRASGVTAEAVTPAVRKSTSDWMKQTIERSWLCETSGPLGGWLEIFLHSSRDSGCAAGGRCLWKGGFLTLLRSL